MEAPAWYFSKALSHRQKVLRLYKRALRQIDYWYLPEILEVRYHKVLMRARFESNKNEADLRKAKSFLIDGVRELWEKRHPQPIVFAREPGGISFERETYMPDRHFDFAFAPMDKAPFPHYFATREKRKKEILEVWEKIMAEKEESLRKDFKEQLPPLPKNSSSASSNA